MHEDTTNDFSEKADANFSDFKQVDDVGTNVNKPYVFLELCAGSASLSAEVKKLGLEVFAFDHDSNRHQTKCKVISMDLSQPHAIDRISAMIHNCVVLGVHIGPPMRDLQQSERHPDGRWFSRSSTIEVRVALVRLIKTPSS